MFDMLTTGELHARHGQAYNDHTRHWLKCRSLPVTHHDYPVIAAAMYEAGEHLRAIGAEITRREQETADA